MYQSPKSELIRIIADPKFKLKYWSHLNNNKTLRETFALYSADVQIVTVIRETFFSYLENTNSETDSSDKWHGTSTYRYSLVLNPQNDLTSHINEAIDVQKLYKLCETRRKFYKESNHIATSNFVSHQK